MKTAVQKSSMNSAMQRRRMDTVVWRSETAVQRRVKTALPRRRKLECLVCQIQINENLILKNAKILFIAIKNWPVQMVLLKVRYSCCLSV